MRILVELEDGNAQRMQAEAACLQSPLVEFPGTRIPSARMAGNTKGEHWILQMNESGFVVTMDKWSAEDFLTKVDTGKCARLIHLSQESEQCQANCTGRTTQNHQRGKSSCHHIQLLEMPWIQAASKMPMSDRLLMAVEESASEMCADGCADSDSFLIS